MDRARAWVESVIGAAVTSLEPLAPGAGARRYWRARGADGRTAVLMHAVPEDPAILPPALRVPRTELPFATLTRLLARHGIPVPELLGLQRDERWLLLEDLGSRHVCDLPAAERAERQREAVDILARVHAVPPGEGLPFDRAFDVEWVAFELCHVLEHGFPEGSAVLAAELDGLARAIAALPRVLCLRDYQSQNLMVDPLGRLRVIDYQDALLAPPELDLAALLYDSYVEITPEGREALLEHYERVAARRIPRDRFALVALERKLKDFARFRYLVRVKCDLRYAPAVAAAAAGLREIVPALGARQRGLGAALAPALEEASP